MPTVASAPTVSVRRKRDPTPDLSPAFKDLAWARFISQGAVREGAADTERLHEYGVLRKRFEEKKGNIEREYWADHAAIAVVLTREKRFFILRMLGLSPRYALHRSTEAASLPYELEAALADGDTLASKAAAVLNPEAAGVVLSRVFDAHRFLLSAVDSEIGADPGWSVTIREALREQDGSEKQGVPGKPVVPEEVPYESLPGPPSVTEEPPMHEAT